MSTTFNDVGLSDALTRALAAKGIHSPFPIQADAIPPALEGKDIQGGAPTGSGKTLAFGLPILSKVKRAERNRPQALVLAPTRELAEQIRKDLDPLAHAVGRSVAVVVGGVGYGPQLKALRSGVDVLVATPGRLEDLIERRSVDLRQVEFVVVDEADRMSDMGFLPVVRRILDQTRSDRQTLLFSATLDGEVGKLSRDYQHRPVHVEAEAIETEQADVDHHFWRMPRNDRPAHTARVIDNSERTIVFTRTRHGADRLVKQLTREGVTAVSMHGGRSQSQRTRALKAFSTGRASALVATDVAARGIHVDGVSTVVHYDLAGDHKDYVHRSGRTARAGDTGSVVTMVVEGQDGEVRKLQKRLQMRLPIEKPDVSRLNSKGQEAHRPKAKIDQVRPADRRPSPVSEPVSEPGTRSLYVGNLPWKATDEDLAELFSSFGTVERATVATQRKGGRSKGYGFVDLYESRQGEAIKALNGAEFGGRPLKVRPAR